MSILLTVALHAEAKPLIEYFGLKQDTRVHILPVFRNESITLVVGGVGKLKAAIATTCILSQLPSPDEALAINIGIAGCTQTEDGPIQPGDLFLIHKITDQATKRTWYPDILLKTGLNEASITTVDAPLARAHGHTIDEGLVDMEASGFFQAAATFLPPHRIICIKVVSDFLEIGRLDKAWINNLIGQQTGALEHVIESYHTGQQLSFDILDSADRNTLSDIRASLRLTVTQYRDLTDWCRAYKLRTQTSLPDLTLFTQVIVTNKPEGRKHLEQLRAILMEP